ncbi:unnamed protein product [Musa acuminata subsp. malaccensis]|uniref:(wild Malaysian banana) hypothetical protein n=1 Tax=Musa acuminata subsp. malaccensis TaxID=214687 RepID=A0A804IJE7_MUSAM|nr:PREDICTED: dual specificity protein phosphatase 1B-like isoform X1 [Musa acuminata subsp. malaccensis]XP_018680947.1 PREDICTED: dual specificity protein phosphatase 1B-like isoform X1 [Musa acuminata subsp. malaccensis]CAG1840783.1 unnamed protein product [Musa acuminata subsp. malaccensis]
MSRIEKLQRSRILACVQALRCARHARKDDVPCQIEEGLFLGSVGAALNKSALKDLNITHLLTVAKSLDPAYPNDFIYKKIDVLDTPSTELDKYFDECFSFIDEARSAGGGVLVHCFAGMSRRLIVTVVVAYVMKKHWMSLSDALSLVRSKRPNIAPNQGFLIQLENFEKSLGEFKSEKETQIVKPFYHLDNGAE